MLKEKPPLAIVSPGRVYRRDYDSTHLPMFTQMEALYVDRKVSVRHLKFVLSEFTKRMYGKNTEIRLRSSFFPFTEPSVEADFSWNDGWNVFRNVGYDPEKWTGFAFGMGLERVAMIKYGVRDMRDLVINDVRFLENY